MTEKVSKKHWFHKYYIAPTVSAIIAGIVVFCITHTISNKKIGDLENTLKETTQLSNDKISDFEKTIISLENTIQSKDSLIKKYEVEINAKNEGNIFIGSEVKAEQIIGRKGN